MILILELKFFCRQADIFGCLFKLRCEPLIPWLPNTTCETVLSSHTVFKLRSIWRDIYGEWETQIRDVCYRRYKLHKKIGHTAVRNISLRKINIIQGGSRYMVAFPLAKPFFDLDNPDCLDFRASWNKMIHTVATCCSDLLLNLNTSFFISFR